MKPIVWLEEIGSADTSRVGGKAWHCARMRRAGLPVPDGLVLAADAPRSDAILGEVQKHLQRWPEALFAVRSSALDEDGTEHSFAGMHDTRLNVPLADVPEAVRQCWASVHSDRALFYRKSQKVAANDLRAAVFVQLMVAATTSGVLFTRNPVTGADEIVINAATGLGDALVSGAIEPDEWRVSKKDLVILSHRSAGSPTAAQIRGQESGVRNQENTGQALLITGQLRELCALALRIERELGGAQDIEWCHDGRQFWIVQARPVTAAPDDEIEWTRANVREVLPDLPPPQVTDFVCEVLNDGMRGYGGRIYAPEDVLGPTAAAFYGRVYFNFSQMRHICSLMGVPPAYILRGVGYGSQLRPEDERVQPRPWKDFIRAMPDFVRTSSYQLHLGSTIRKYLRRLREEVEFTRRKREAGLDERAMWAHMKARRKEAWRELTPVFALSAIGTLEEQLRKILRRIPYPYEKLVPPLLTAGEKSVSSQQGFDLLRLAAMARAESRTREYFLNAGLFGDFRAALAGTEFLREFEEFLAEYGHRGLYETDWSRPRYAEDPTPLLAAISAHVKSPSSPSPEETIAAQEHNASEAWQQFEAALNRRQRLTVLPVVRALLRRIKQMYLWRELYRSELTRVGTQVRKWHLDLAAKLIARGWIHSAEDYFMLTYSELGALIESRMTVEDTQSLIRQRRADLEAWRDFDMPLWLRESDLPRIRARRWTTSESIVREFTGLCVSAGFTEGEVVVLRSPMEFARMKRGAIIVAPATDPSWTPLFTLASGLIVEIGGTLSHAATVAREYGLPALANVAEATRLLKDGDLVRLDATSGQAQVLSSARAAENSIARTPSAR